MDKNKEIQLDFVFVDEIYKLDNGFIIDEVSQENERDVAYRIALHELLKTPHVDSLLTGPYIALPTKDKKMHNSHLKLSLTIMILLLSTTITTK